MSGTLVIESGGRGIAKFSFHTGEEELPHGYVFHLSVLFFLKKITTHISKKILIQ